MDILNPRELASLIWFVGVAGFLIWKAKAWGALVGVFRTLCKPIILRVVGMMAAWVAASVWLLARIGMWELANLKTTLIWFFAFALGWMFDLKRWEGDPNQTVKSVAGELLGVTTAVTFFAEFYTFSFPVEMVLVPVVTFIALLGVFAQGRHGHGGVAKLIGGAMSIIGLSLLVYAAWRLFSDLRGFATPETGREFAVPALLSLLFLPFMYVLGVQNAYGEVSRILYFTIKDPAICGFARRRLFLWFGLDVALLRRWRVALFKLDTDTQAQVHSTVLVMKAARRRERGRPHVPHEFGWSPYRAAKFLAHHGLDAGRYNPGYSEWCAQSAPRQLDDNSLGDQLRYKVSGTEEIATRLELTFTADRLRPVHQDTPPAAYKAFLDANLALLHATFRHHGAEVTRGLVGENGRGELDGVVVELIEDEDDGTKLIITHPLHRDADDIIAEKVLRVAGARASAFAER